MADDVERNYNKGVAALFERIFTLRDEAAAQRADLAKAEEEIAGFKLVNLAVELKNKALQTDLAKAVEGLERIITQPYDVRHARAIAKATLKELRP